jgi:hypothetical protein
MSSGGRGDDYLELKRTTSARRLNALHAIGTLPLQGWASSSRTAGGVAARCAGRVASSRSAGQPLA